MSAASTLLCTACATSPTFVDRAVLVNRSASRLTNAAKPRLQRPVPCPCPYTRDFVDPCRALGTTPHVAQHQTCRRSAIDERTTRHAGDSVSQQVRKRIEQVFGWAKTVAGFRRTRYRGQRRTQFAAHLVGAAYHLRRVARLRLAAST